MRFFAAAFTFFTLAGSALSASIPPTVTKYDGETSGQHIVQVFEGADKATLIQQIKDANGQITYDLPIIHGFAGSFSDAVMKMILSSPVVKSVSEDGMMYTSDSGKQPNAPWGLDRISHSNTLKGKDSNALAYEYYYPDDSLGDGVNIYIVDTGVQTTHKAFGGRAKWGKTFGPYLPIDGNGHGTHVAGTTGGHQYGVAQKASIIAVKVMSDLGFGFTSDIVAGLNWVKEQCEKDNKPSVVNMSLGGSADQALDDAVRSLTTAGVHVAVAAGNSNEDAGNTSPARELSAVTVAASTIDDERASFSSFGKVVDIFAPGVNVTSAWIGLTNSDTKTISGTSMATPHITGLIAYLLKAEGPRTPDAMSKRLQELALKDVLTGVPGDTVNFLAQNHH